MNPCPRTLRRVWILGMMMLVATVVPVAAQDITGALQGTVLSPEGKPEPKVRVRVSGPHQQGTRETVTARAGARVTRWEPASIRGTWRGRGDTRCASPWREWPEGWSGLAGAP